MSFSVAGSRLWNFLPASLQNSSISLPVSSYLLTFIYLLNILICLLTFLLSVGWLEPLLDRIAANRSNVVAPVIDVIDDKTMQYKFGDARATNVGGFEWNLQFNWHGIPEREKRRRKLDIDPIR